MEIKYSKHLEQRLILRGIGHELPALIFNQSEERYYDEETGYMIATMGVQLYNKPREVMVAYVIEQKVAKLLTIHPLKGGQRQKRVETGRWRKIE
jgi:hypothetical protein